MVLTSMVWDGDFKSLSNIPQWAQHHGLWPQAALSSVPRETSQCSHQIGQQGVVLLERRLSLQLDWQP